MFRVFDIFLFIYFFALLFGSDLRYVVLPLAGSFSVGYGSTLAVFMFLLSMCVTAVYLRRIGKT